MSEVIICPNCNNKIEDLNEFKKTLTCPVCKAFLKNNKEIAKILSRQSARRNAAVTTKNIMGINVSSEEDTTTSQKSNRNSKQEAQQSVNNVEQKEKPSVNKNFNQKPCTQESPKPINAEDAALFTESSDYISPELEALYDDDDYITENSDSTEEDVAMTKNNEKEDEYYDPDEDDFNDGLWADSEDEGEEIVVTATLASLDDDEPEYNDSDILGLPHTMSQEEIDDDFDKYPSDDDEKIDDNTEENEEQAGSTDGIDNNSNNEIPANEPHGSDLDLFSDLNAVAKPQPSQRRKSNMQPSSSTVKNVVPEVSVNEDDEYYNPDEDDSAEYNNEDDIDSNGYEEFEENYDDDYGDDYDDEELEDIEDEMSNDAQGSIASRFFKKIKNTKHSSNKDTGRTDKSKESVSVIDINDDIGRKVDKKVFNSNKDGYYNDRQPFVDPEPDIIPSGSILKVIGIFAGLIFFTAYFIYML